MVSETTQGTQTATRGLQVVAALAEAGEPLRLRELLDRVSITKAAAHRILYELVRQDLVVRSADNLYSVGPAMVALASRVLHDDALRINVHPLLERLGAITSETITLHLRTGADRVCIDTVESPHPIRRVVALGQVLPVHVGPAGKVILALLPEAEQERILAASELAPEAVDHVRGQLEHLRRRGYIAAEGDRVAGVGGFAFALSRDGQPVASVVISGPANRWSLEVMRAAVPAIQEACEGIQPWTASISRFSPSEFVMEKEAVLDV